MKMNEKKKNDSTTATWNINTTSTATINRIKQFKCEWKCIQRENVEWMSHAFFFLAPNVFFVVNTLDSLLSALVGSYASIFFHFIFHNFYFICANVSFIFIIISLIVVCNVVSVCYCCLYGALYIRCFFLVFHTHIQMPLLPLFVERGKKRCKQMVIVHIYFFR